MVKYEGILVCPVCGTRSKQHKLLGEWTHGLHFVNKLECKNCGFIFRAYFGNHKDGTPFLYTIPKRPDSVMEVDG